MDAQNNSFISNLFYGLHPDSSRIIIKKEIESDKRFLDDQSSAYFDDSFSGKVLDKGFIEMHSDSIKIQLSYAIRGKTTSDDKPLDTGEVIIQDLSILSINYYFFLATL